MLGPPFGRPFEFPDAEFYIFAMPATPRQAQLGAAFVTLSDSLVNGFDVVDLLDALVAECQRLLDVDEADLVLMGTNKKLRTMATTSDRAMALDEVQLDVDEGPCIESFTTGEVVTIDDIGLSTIWPAFRARADEAGLRIVHAVSPPRP
jgi:hypothetical protein